MNISNIIKLNRGLSLNIHTNEWITTNEYKICKKMEDDKSERRSLH